MKNEGWREVTVRFNAENLTSKKTETQIRQKWKNVKKDAKKKHNPRRGWCPCDLSCAELCMLRYSMSHDRYLLSSHIS